jgi:hypothetical protein
VKLRAFENFRRLIYVETRKETKPKSFSTNLHYFLEEYYPFLLYPLDNWLSSSVICSPWNTLCYFVKYIAYINLSSHFQKIRLWNNFNYNTFHL